MHVIKTDAFSAEDKPKGWRSPRTSSSLCRLLTRPSSRQNGKMRDIAIELVETRRLPPLDARLATRATGAPADQTSGHAAIRALRTCVLSPPVGEPDALDHAARSRPTLASWSSGLKSRCSRLLA
jgi:hypothetical protein